jgi:hypothetical protein
MGIISLLIKAFLLYMFFTFAMAVWRIFRSFKVLKDQGRQAQDFFNQGQQHGGFGQGGHSQTSNNAPAGDVFDAEYRVVKEEN